MEWNDGKERAKFENEQTELRSRENIEWAKTLSVSEAEDERRICCLNIHTAVLDGFLYLIRTYFI